MATYKLTLLMVPAVLALQSPDNFCDAKKVYGSFTTVFQDASSIKPKSADQMPLLNSNVFEWTEHLPRLAATNYKHGMLPLSATGFQRYKQREPSPSEKKRHIFASNQFKAASPAAHDAFESSSGDSSYEVPNTLHTSVELQVKGKWAPIYVDPDAHLGTMEKQLTPLNEYMLFWDNRVQTSSVIDVSKFHFPFTFNFEGGVKSRTIRFGYSVPNKPSPGETAEFFSVDV